MSLNLVAIIVGLTHPNVLGRRISPCPVREVATVRTEQSSPPETTAAPLQSTEAATAATAAPTTAAPSTVKPVSVTEPHQPQQPQVRVGSSSICKPSFVVEPCRDLMDPDAAHKFDDIYAKQGWGTRQQELGTHTKSGLGSDMKGAFDWITGLSKFFNQNPE